MNEVFQEVKSIIDVQLFNNEILESFWTSRPTSKFFIFSNEKIMSYLRLANINGNEKTLTIAGSGDQVFSLLSKGVTEIDTFDVNLLAEQYAFGLKKALILRYDYQMFCHIIQIFCCEKIENGNINELISQIIMDAIPAMDFQYREFWQRIVDYNWHIQPVLGTKINLMHLLGILNVPFDYCLKHYDYLKNAASYNKMRQNLLKSNISFQLANATNIGKQFSKKYDLLCLSNCLDFVRNVWGENWDYERLKAYLDSLSPITNPNSQIFLQYIFDYNPEYELFDSSDVYLKDLQGLEVHELPIENPLYPDRDAIILKRERNTK